MNTFDFGIIGLGVMGRNLLLNMADQKFAVAGLDLDEEKVFSLTHEANPQHRIKATIDVKEFVGLIKQPRAIMLLVPAGKPVDTAIESLLPYLDKGDILIDGGNTYFTDTDRRFTELSDKGIHFLEWVSPEEKKEHALVLVLCPAVIKKLMKGYALYLNP